MVAARALNDADVADAMARFEATVEDIEQTRETNSWSNLDGDNLPDEETCNECDVWRDCPYRDYDDRYGGLSQWSDSHLR